MNHASSVDIHDHVYGFRSSPHVSECPQCRALAERVARERVVLKGALAEEPIVPDEKDHGSAFRARTSRLSSSGLAAAGLLLCALAWVLFHGPKPSPTDFSGPATRLDSDGELDRLIAELGSRSPERREIAVLALKAYGEAALDKLAKAKVDPALFGNYRLKPADVDVDRRLRTTTMDLDLEATPLEDVLSNLSEKGGVKIVIDPDLRQRLDLKKSYTFKVKGLLLINVLKLFLSQDGLDFRAEDGAVVLLDPRGGKAAIPAPGQAPVRIGRMNEAAARLLTEFTSNAVERREEARRRLVKLGFAAEEALWQALDSPDLETKGQASDLLRTLYTPSLSALPLSYPRTRGVKKTLFEDRVTVDFKEIPLITAVDQLREKAAVNVHLSGINHLQSSQVSFQCRDLPAFSAFLFCLDPLRISGTASNEVFLLTPEESTEPQKIRRFGNFWTSPEEARRLEQALLDLAGTDVARREQGTAVLRKLGDRALPLLTRAADILEGPSRERCIALRSQIQTVEDPKGFDEPVAEELSPLNDGQRDVLNREADLAVEDLRLEDLLKSYGVPVEIRSSPQRTFRFQARGVRLGTALRALSRPFGLDFYFQGERIIVDQAVEVRKALVH